jgi:hypothetical protein
MSYLRFAAMIATSTVVMFILMYLNTFAWEHVFWSETRVYMAILMGATMAIIMLGYMLSMYKNTKINIGIFVCSALVFALSLWLVRSQATVSGVSYMRAMIPHHSIAIMTSERAQITDPRVRKLADEIIEAQRREIAEMRYLIADLEGDEDAVHPEIVEGDQVAEIGTVSEALSAPLIAALDPAPLHPAEADNVLEPGPGCQFSRTAEGEPILIARAPAGESGVAQGVMKLNGKLVPLEATEAGGLESLVPGTVMAADGVRMSVRRSPDEGAILGGILQRSNAELVFELEQGLTVGYRGFYTCEA